MRSPLLTALAARQYSGTAGGVALCQVAVTLTYASGRGHALIGRALISEYRRAASQRKTAGQRVRTSLAQDTDAHVIGDPDGFYGEQVMAWAEGKVQKLRMREIAAAEAAPAAAPAADQAGAVLS